MQTDTYYDAGIAFPVGKNIIWALVCKYEQFADNTTALKTREIGVWVQVQF